MAPCNNFTTHELLDKLDVNWANKLAHSYTTVQFRNMVCYFSADENCQAKLNIYQQYLAGNRLILDGCARNHN